MPTRNCCQLHCHTAGSFRDGLPLVDELVQRAAELEHPGIGLTNHGNLFDAAQFFKACADHDIKGVIGMEAYEAVPHEFDLERDGPVFKQPYDRSNPRYYHLTLWVQNVTGWKNLAAMHTQSFMKHHKPKNQPLLDRAMLERHNEGLIVGLGCIASRTNQALERSGLEDAKRAAAWYKEVFGDRVYVEVMGNLAEQVALMHSQRQLAKYLDVPTLGTNDVHYLRREDGVENGPHHLLVRARRWAKKEGEEESADKSDAGYGQWYGSDEFFLKDEPEMLATVGMLPQEVHQSVELLSRVDFDFGALDKPAPPVAPIPQPGEDPAFDLWLEMAA